MTLKAIETAVLKLPKRARGKLAASLLESLDTAQSGNFERLWVEEAERRYRAHRVKGTSTIPAAKVLSDARRALQQ